MTTTTGHRIYGLSVTSVYPLYLAKLEKKGRTQGELDAVIRWLTGFDEAELERHLAAGTTFEEFFAAAPSMAAFASPTISSTAAGYSLSRRLVGPGWLTPAIPSMSTLM